MSLRDILPFRRHEDADDPRHADRTDIAAFNEARSDEERSRVIAGVRARARANRK
jgi:hypothetical protein